MPDRLPDILQQYDGIFLVNKNLWPNRPRLTNIDAFLQPANAVIDLSSETVPILDPNTPQL